MKKDKKGSRKMKEYYENKVAVVTGGASGIGLALCEMLLSFGAKGPLWRM